MENVPVLDLSGDTAKAVETMDQALREYGFFYVTNHGVDPALVQQQFDTAAELFALPQDQKDLMPFDPQLDIGYVGRGVQSLDPDGTVQPSGDTKEQFMMTNNRLISDPTFSTDPTNVFQGSQNYTPPNVPSFAEMTRAYGSALFRLNQQLNDILFQALKLGNHDSDNDSNSDNGTTDAETESSTRVALGKEPFVVLKQMRYAGEPSDPGKGKFGAGAHTDWGSFTILATDNTPGLEIFLPKNESWLPVPPRPGMFIINSGDQIAQLTNDVYKSALHRVVTLSTKPRYSIAFFTYFGVHAKVGPLAKFVTPQQPAAYPHRTTLEHFHFKLHESMGVGVSTAASG